MQGHSETDLMLKGYGLTTAKILYHYPDHPHLLQTYIWQDYDIAPRFPVLIRFIEFWRAKLEGPLHSVIYTHRRLIAPNEWRNVNGEFLLNCLIARKSGLRIVTRLSPTVHRKAAFQKSSQTAGGIHVEPIPFPNKPA